MRNWVIAVIVVTTGYIANISGRETASQAAITSASGTPDLSLSFEVASVKPSSSSEPRGMLSLTPGSFAASNHTLNRLIAFAFDVRRFQVVGVPKWADSMYWRINARTPAGSRWMEEYRAMLRRLLETRFALKHRRELRNLPVYELRRARPDGALGPHLTPFDGECGDFRLREGKLEALPEAPGIQCRFGVSQNRADAVGADWVDFNLAREFTELDRLVVDKTGLVGKFNVKMRWSSDPRDSGPEDVSLFTALREQLGLTLEPTTAPVEVIVVEEVRLLNPD